MAEELTKLDDFERFVEAKEEDLRDALVENNEMKEDNLGDILVENCDIKEENLRDTLVENSELKEENLRDTLVENSELKEENLRDTLVENSESKEENLRDTLVENSDIKEENSSDKVACDKAERETWGGQFEFVLSLVGYTVGLGNIWRFPYFCFRNSGGIAIIPFLLFVVVCCGPLYYIEVCLGQFSGQSPINVWNICPLFKGIGLNMVIISFTYLWYYGIAFAWVLYFLIQSFYPILGWSSCSNSWNTDACVDSNINISKKMHNVSTNTTQAIFKTSGTEFWELNVLHKSSGIEETGSLQIHLIGCLFLGWFLVFLCLARGVKTLGKVVYVTATMPYVLLTILCIRGATLDGAWIGLRLYLVPDFSKLFSGQLWMEAAVMSFYSLGPAWGGVITMASFNKFHHNALRDTLIVCTADVFTGFFGGLVVFSVLGFLSKETGVALEDLPFSGPGLAFIAYPEALSRLPLPHVWSVLFFLTLVLVGIDTQFSMFETVTNTFIDLDLKKYGKYRLLISAVVMIVLAILGLPLASSAGFYIFILVDWYMASFNLVFICFMECFVISWIYGANRFCSDIEMMRGSRPSLLLRIIWVFVIPLFIGGILMTTVSSYSAPNIDEGGYKYPYYALVIGNLFAFGPMSAVILTAGYQILRTKGSIRQRLSKLIKPSAVWQPHDKKYGHIFQTRPFRYEYGFKRRFLCNILGLKES
ncbi:sodium- and chloride-dependent glycine transporter 1-like [Mercenaria mercenaria]|uniref:sodium- and chloride-dependent glycine transporter 1-like n=1 Tax=Mercenaria mercenaria TaxID=6596 RepID=UPI00234EE134|nr:sodium- and chloride-dependent glycine transporter 1-like [Mercenaria mercenaria]